MEWLFPPSSAHLATHRITFFSPLIPQFCFPLSELYVFLSQLTVRASSFCWCFHPPQNTGAEEKKNEIPATNLLVFLCLCEREFFFSHHHEGYRVMRGVRVRSKNPKKLAFAATKQHITKLSAHHQTSFSQNVYILSTAYIVCRNKNEEILYSTVKPRRQWKYVRFLFSRISQCV